MMSFLSTSLLILLLCSEDLVLSRKLRSKTSKELLRKKAKNPQKSINHTTKIFYHRNYKWPLPKISINWKSIYVITKKPTNKIHCKIFCRSGYHLQILPSGLVRGTVDQQSKYVVFEMQSFGPSLVKLKSVATGRYLSMKKDGTLRATRHVRSRETIFKETHEMNAFHSYASHKYFTRDPHDMLVGIKRSGQVKRATQTMHGQTATQFLVINN